jgi:hypothetical protein
MTHREYNPGLTAVPEEKVGYTAKLKVYPDGSTAITAAERPIFRPEGWEARRPEGKPKADALGDPEDRTIRPGREEWEAARRRAAASLARSKRRALTSLRDYCLCNKFRWFVTLTLDRARIDRYDYEVIIRAMKTWCDNQVRRKGLKYILVPERHKDGAIHFHGFFPDGVAVEDSGTISMPGEKAPKKPRSAAGRARMLARGGHIVYNLPDWKFGFSTAIELYGNYHAAVAYVCKYVSKADGKVGGRWYFSGGKLNKPELQYSDLTLSELLQSGTAREYEVPDIGLRLGYDFVELKGEWNERTGYSPDREGPCGALRSGEFAGDTMGAVQSEAETVAHGAGVMAPEQSEGCWDSWGSEGECQGIIPGFG